MLTPVLLLYIFVCCSQEGTDDLEELPLLSLTAVSHAVLLYDDDRYYFFALDL